MCVCIVRLTGRGYEDGCVPGERGKPSPMGTGQVGHLTS